MAVPLRVSAADSSVVVLGLRSLEGDDDFANSMTEALRTAAKSVSGWRVLERAVSMSQMVLANNCDDVDAACLGNIARGLEAERVIYGTVRRTAAPSKYNYEISLNLFNATSRTITGPETETVQRNDGKKVLVRYAQLLISHLSATEASVGRLIIDVNVLSATVHMDGALVGETQDRKLTLEGVVPGEHTLEVSATGHETYKQTIYVHASEQSEVGVTLERTPEPEDVAAATAAPPEAVAPAAPEQEGHASLNWLGYTLIGVGAASAIAWGASMYVIEFQYNRNSTYQRYKNSYQNFTDDACDAALKGDNPGRLSGSELSDFQSRCRTGRTFQILQWVFLGAAVVAAGSGVFVLLSDGGGHETQTALRPLPRLALEPVIDRRQLSLQATLRF